MGGNSHNRNAIISCTVNSMSTAITRRKEVYVHPRRDAPVVKRGCYGVHNIFRRVTLANVSLVCCNTHPIAVACSSGVRTKLFLVRAEENSLFFIEHRLLTCSTPHVIDI